MFENSLSLVTGAASGLGLAVTQQLAAAGSRVLALDLNAPPNLSEVEFIECDVSDPQAWQIVADRIKAQGALNYVHLNAGIQIAPVNAPLSEYQFENMQLERYRKMMGVNVDGVVFGLQSLLPLMPSGGAVVVTSSLAGVTPYAVDPLYAMSKHAVSGLVRSLAEPLSAKSISISALCPGGIDTAIIPEAQRTDKAVFMRPEHVAGEVLELFKPSETGKTWAKVSEAKPAFIIRAPGDKQR